MQSVGREEEKGKRRGRREVGNHRVDPGDYQCPREAVEHGGWILELRHEQDRHEEQ